MQNLFIGMLLVFLDFNLNLGESTVGLIPDFLGYFMLAKGFAELAGESHRFEKSISIAKGAAVYSGVLYALDLLGISAGFGSLSYPLSIVSMVFNLYLSYQIAEGVCNIESARDLPLEGQGLKSAWIAVAILNVLSYPALIAEVLNTLIVIGALVANIVFLVCLNKTKKLYSAACGE